MKTPIMIVAALGLLAPLAVAHHSEEHSANTSSHDMPTSAIFGLCNAWAHNENGREHGNAGNAPPFLWLAEQADEDDQTVEEWCADNAGRDLP